MRKRLIKPQTSLFTTQITTTLGS